MKNGQGAGLFGVAGGEQAVLAAGFEFGDAGSDFCKQRGFGTAAEKCELFVHRLSGGAHKQQAAASSTRIFARPPSRVKSLRDRLLKLYTCA